MGGLTVGLILPKSPIPAEGRVGRTEWQDWYRSCAVAAKLYKRREIHLILIISAFKTGSEGSEYERMKAVLVMHGVDPRYITHIEEGLETIEQIQTAKKYMSGKKARLVTFCTLTHWPRVHYLCWKEGLSCRRKVAILGLPRPREALTDAALTILFPLIDLFGLREWFLSQVKKRRSEGVL